MRRVASATLLLAGALLPSMQAPWTDPVEAGVPGLGERLRSEDQRREIDRHAELMGESCGGGVCVLLPSYPPVIAHRFAWSESSSTHSPEPRSPEGWLYEQQRLKP